MDAVRITWSNDWAVPEIVKCLRWQSDGKTLRGEQISVSPLDGGFLEVAYCEASKLSV